MSSEDKTAAEKASEFIMAVCPVITNDIFTSYTTGRAISNRIQQAIDEEKLAMASMMIKLADEITLLKKENAELKDDYLNMRSKALKRKRR